MAIKEGGAGRQAFNVFNYTFLFLMMIVTLYPLWLQLITSISHGLEVMKGGISFLPRHITFETYKTIVRGELFMYMRNTVIYTVLGTIVNLIMSCLCAYPLSRKTFSGRKFFTAMVTVTLFFSGGMIPLYLTVKQFELMDTIWALIIPGAINTYNMMIMRSAFASVPSTLYEAAYLDGASHPRILTQIYIPLSGATLAVMVLYYAVGHWNSWFNASIYISDTTKYPLQLVLRQILMLNQNQDLKASVTDNGELAKYADQVKYALIVVSSAPILMLYPFLQRFFTKGVMVGALKG